MLYLVDGYNLILTTRFRDMDTERAREYLVAFCKVYAPHKVIVVFDGQKGRGPGLEGAVFTRGQSADDYIKFLVKKADNPRQITVVTEDREIRGYVGNLGARVMSTREFVKGPRRVKTGKPGPTPREKARINQELKELWDIK